MTRTDLRTKLLADTILGTDTAFDLIEEIAAIPGVKWSHAPCIGLRGSIGGAVAPTAERIRGADPETEEPFESPMDGRSLRWKEEEQALCPIAIREWHANNVDDLMILECIHTEPWDAVSKAWWERFPAAPKKPVASALWPVPVAMIPWMLIIHAADEAPLEGETSVEPHKTPYTLEQLLTTVKALHVWLIETTQSRPARIDELDRGPVRHRRERDHVAESPAMSTMVGALRSTACRRADQDREAHGTAAGTMGRCRPCPISRTSTAG